jgi:hypothetical protein
MALLDEDEELLDLEESGEVEVEDADEPEEAEAIDTLDAEAEPELTYDEEAPNLVPELLKHPDGIAALKEMADFAVDQFDAAWEAQEGYRERLANDLRLFTGDLPEKLYPFKNCANAHVPIMLENITRLQMRAAGELFGDWTAVATVLPVGPDDRETADILSRHANWQISTSLTDFKRQMMRALLMFFMAGDTVCHSYWDAAKKRNKHEVLTPDDFVIPHVHTTVEPDFSDCPWVAKVLYRYKHELQRMRDEWHDVDAVIERKTPSWDDEPNAPIREEATAVSGVEASDEQKAPYKLLHWEGWLELPNQVDERFCKLVVDHETRNVLQLQILEEEDWQDKLRHQTQEEELGRYRMELEAFNSSMLSLASGETLAPIGPDGMPFTPPPPPMVPSWLESAEQASDPLFAPDPVRKVPIHMFSHAVCIEPPSGPLGIGYGRIQADYNRAGNTVLSQFVDAATLANGGSYIVADGVSFESPLEVAPGKVNVAKGVTPGELDKSLKEIKAPPANPQLIEVLKLVEEWGQSSMQAPSVLSGESGKSGETFRGISTRVEQATKQLTVVTSRFGDFVAQVLKNNAKLNAKFMDENEIVFVNNHKLGTAQELRIGRQLYERDYRVVLRSDLRFASQAQRITEADQTLSMVSSLPQLQNNIPLMFQALKEALIARSQEHLVPFLGPEPAPPPTTLGIPPPPPMMPPGMPLPGPDGPPPEMMGPPPGMEPTAEEPPPQ